MFHIILGFIVFLLSMVVGVLVLALGPDAGLTAVQGSLMLFACLFGVWQGSEIISHGGKL
jgi:hypothetical protein